jgi:predicted permease
MFNNLYDVDFGGLGSSGYVGFAVVSTLILIVLSFLLVPIFEKENARKGVITQAIFRSNSVLYAIPLAESVFGAEGATMASIVVAFVVPIYNIASVVILEYYRGGKVSFGKLLFNILKNPLIIGAIAGVIFNLLPITMPQFLAKPVSELCSMATPLSLFVLGGTLHLSDAKKNIIPLSVGTILKLVAVPTVLCLAMAQWGLRGAELFVVFCMFATPVAAASYPMAQSMDADADLAGEYVVLTTVLSIATIFCWILILREFGLI